MIHIDTKFISLVSARLGKFKNTKKNLFTFRCPYCGDSQKNKNKTRGYLYPIKTSFNFKCHNCGMSKSFTNFLKDMDPQLYDQYIFERYKSGLSGKGTTVPDKVFEFKKPVFAKKLNLPKAVENDRAAEYLKSRDLDPNDFYYAKEFKHFCNTLKPSYNDIQKDHDRVVIPMYDENKKLIGLQGRALDKFIEPKYLTLMLDEEHPKVYGLDKIDKGKPVYVTEGPFDSHFVDNAIAMCGSDITIDNVDSNYIYVYDNEPRNREIVSKISNAIEHKHKVVIFPSEIRQKDINDMHLAGLDIQSLLECNTYHGLEAKLKLQTWKRV